MPSPSDGCNSFRTLIRLAAELSLPDALLPAVQMLATEKAEELTVEQLAACERIVEGCRRLSAYDDPIFCVVGPSCWCAAPGPIREVPLRKFMDILAMGYDLGRARVMDDEDGGLDG